MREINEGLISRSAIVTEMQGWQWIDRPSADIYQRYSKVFQGGGMKARQRALELKAQALWWITYMLQQPRHAALTLRIDEPHLLSPHLPFPLISTILPSPILHFHLCPFVLSHTNSFHFLHVSVSLAYLMLHLYLGSHSYFFIAFPLYCLTVPLLSVCQHQEGEPWTCHTNKVRGSISVSHGDTFINDRSTRPCRCSITSTGACP